MTAVKKDPKTTVSHQQQPPEGRSESITSTVHRRLHEQKYRGYTRRCKPLISKKIGDEPQKFWDKALWTDFMDQSDGKAKVWRKKDLLMIPNIQAHLKHSGGNVMAWAFIASSGTGSLIFINDVTHDGSSKINSEVFRNILSDSLQKDATKLIGRSFIMQQDNDPKHSAQTTKEFIRARSGRF